MGLLLFIVAIVLLFWGVITVIKGAILVGIILIVAGLLVGAIGAPGSGRSL